ncbi:hypothetical protein TSAR_007004, partial [Trichomalopsis sarcophagae]
MKALASPMGKEYWRGCLLTRKIASYPVACVEILPMSNHEGATRAVLCFLGVWPDIKRKNLISRTRFLLPTLIMLYFAIIPQTTMAIKVWGDLNAVLEVLTISDISIAIALFKMLGLWHNKD